jgi:hypothetical protein
MCFTNKTPLAIGSTGEIYLRGPNIAQEYWKSPKATAEAFSPDGWFQTGDVGHLDESGFLYISDRAKEIVSAFCIDSGSTLMQWCDRLSEEERTSRPSPSRTSYTPTPASKTPPSSPSLIANSENS